MEIFNIRKVLFGLFIISVCFTSAQDFPWYDENRSFDERASLLVDAMTLEEKISQMVMNSAAIDRLGVPEYDWWNEALHGVARTGRATVFPQAIGMAATFDPELMNQVATAISDEARAKFNESQRIGNRSRYSGLTFWSPNVNIFRDPRWGRGQETYGEDPFLTGQLGMAFVRGLQGDHPKYLKTAACAKHYAVHSGPEALRHEFDAVVGMKDMYETYLPAFEDLVVKADVEGVMGAYNRTNGEPCAGSEFLLQKVLKGDWRFDGYIVSDCWGILDFHQYHKVTKTAEESAALALKNGTNVNCGVVYNELGGAIEQGLIKEEDIDNALKHLYLTRFELGLFDKPESNPFTNVSLDVIESDKHRNLAREVAAKSIVMLKNDGVLPLKKDIRTLHVSGPHAASEEILLGNYFGLSGNTVTILDGIVNRVSLGTTVNYKQGVLAYRDNINPIDWTTGEARGADAAVVVMGISGLFEGEEGESLASANKGDKTDLKLPQNQIDFVKKVAEDNDKPVILVLTGGSPIAIPELHDLVDAVLFVWYPGEEGGNAVADVIFGDVSPSGRLPITFPKSIDQLPAYEDYNMKGRTYRYMEKEPLYPFGFGLTYANFEYNNAIIEKNDGKVVATVEVTNAGSVSAEEVTQFFIASPLAGSEDPIQSLKGLKRTNIEPGETVKISYELDQDAVMQFTDEGEKILRKGTYVLKIGGSTPNQRSLDLGASQWAEVSFDAEKIFK
ncbi:MAG: glycoside hydrolase family 3 C-terminal domain-containing protein [Cyclobacteriaceae bacterium]